MKIISFNILFVFYLLAKPVVAQDVQPTTSRPDSHAPIGVMGDHLHQKSEFMATYRYLHMSMKDNRDGTDDLTPETIVTTVPNRFFGMPMQPPTLRVVPTDMQMDMHMFGLMFAPADWITLMAMAMVVRKEMAHITYQGGMGLNQLGTFETKSSGIGDTRLMALIKLLSKGAHKMHLNAGLSLPTGSSTEEDQILTPLDTRPTVRIPYAMQLGSGTFDLLPGITYYSHSSHIGWGTQLMAKIRLGDNNEDYSLGNVFQATAWGSYMFTHWISTGVRLTYLQRSNIEGIDSKIVAPVQTADPDFQGGMEVNGSFNVNLIGQSGFIHNHRLALEFGLPLLQDLYGPQLKVRSNLMIGWQFAF